MPGTTVSLPSVTVTARSATWGVSVAVAELLAVFGSNWSAWLMAVVFVCVPGLTTKAVMFSVCGTPVLTVPTVHIPLPLV